MLTKLHYALRKDKKTPLCHVDSPEVPKPQIQIIPFKCCFLVIQEIKVPFLSVAEKDVLGATDPGAISKKDSTPMRVLHVGYTFQTPSAFNGTAHRDTIKAQRV